jgi:tetratricopeptide (TPR) repeat protein
VLSFVLQWHKGARVPERIVSHYRIVEKIGGGGMGVVYKAVDTKLGRIVALKFLPPDATRDETAKKRFLHEAQAASLLDHPNICSIHEIDETDKGQVFISMAYYEGTSLRDRIKEGVLPVREAFEIIFSVADGLASAHQRGIVHRDIKPGNVIVTKEGFVKIVDFGLAKLADRSRVTRTGLTPGTLSYMSPEQVTGKDIDGRSDIWSLGVLAYEMLTGELPFEGDIEAAVMYQILSENPAPIRKKRTELPAEFEAIVHKCLQKDPAQRYQSCGELIGALNEMSMRLGWQSSGTVRTAMRVGKFTIPRRHRLVIGVVTAGVVIAAALGWYWATQRRPEPVDLYSTQVRLAALPIENLARESVPDEFVNGLSEWLVAAFERTGASHRSMWVVPYNLVIGDVVVSPSEAKDALGVNQVLTGSIQRYGDGYRLSLELLDAASLRRIRTAHVDYSADVSALQSGIVDAAAELAGVTLSPAARNRVDAGFTSNGTAFERYMVALGYLQQYRSQDNLDRAFESLQTAVQADPRFAEATAALSLAYLNACTFRKETAACDSAWAISRRTLGIDSSAVYVNLIAGAVARGTRRLPASVAAYRRILAVEPRNKTAYWEMGSVLNQMDRVDEAEAAQRASVAAAPDCWQTHVHLGWFFNQRGRAPEVIEQYEKALALAPNNFWTLNSLGNIYLTKNDWVTAREYYLRAFRVKPDCWACSNIGVAYFIERQLADAEKYFRLALQYCDSTSSRHYMRWQDLAETLYWIEGRRPEAEQAFRRAIALEEVQLQNTPDDPSLLAYTSGCYAKIGDRARALELAERVAAMESDDPTVLYVVGQTYEQLAVRERALHFIASAIRHGYPVKWLEGDPGLQELVKDIRFRQLVEVNAGETSKEKVKTQ